MKKFIVFSISFLVLFGAFQVISGYFMTLFYTSDVPSAWGQSGSLSSSVIIKESPSFSPFLLAFFAATIAYFAPKIFIKNSSN
ncbi:hypothetical protein JNUCC1_03728 [Lentibacillus sp. JNUCC-1]|uniref:hypothetical protein n=1 Tax=Lentibacillus sp. JNUCC-1 TaxID=2654513 RepID=UPI0012E83A50|nr:hypothetical protein [Lentibacillus sp. JNUCC-1]MUV39844.1 hypothetical protein [Lentibacillus sp. JNUCC-1]